MPTERDWADGFLAQAQADLGAARVLATQTPITVASASVFSMLLQMAFEKFAKAALLRSGSMSYSDAKSSHKGASRMVAAMRVQKKLMAPFGGPHIWTAVFEVIEELERAQPSLAKARVSQSNVARDSCSTTNRPPPKASGKHTTSVPKTLGSRGVSLWATKCPKRSISRTWKYASP